MAVTEEPDKLVIDIDWPEELVEVDDVAEITPATATAPPQVAPTAEPVRLPPVGTALTVDHVRVSENTYAFRLRWSNPVGVTPKRPAIYFQWVHRSVFEMITETKESYGNFKATIIAQFSDEQKAV